MIDDTAKYTTASTEDKRKGMIPEGTIPWKIQLLLIWSTGPAGPWKPCHDGPFAWLTPRWACNLQIRNHLSLQSMTVIREKHKTAEDWMPVRIMIWLNMQTGSCVGGLLSTSYRREEDDHMSDYEIIMVFLTILTLLFLAMSFVSNRKS